MASPTKPGTIEAPPAINSLSSTKWTRPDYQPPVPSLQFLFHLECDMEDFHRIGQGPFGNRSTVIFKGGRFEGPRMRGTILPGGGDWEIVQDHDDVQTAHLNTRYNLQTHDGAIIYIQTTGTRTGKRSVLEKLGEDQSITPDQFRMRLNLMLETGDPRYSWVNDGVFIASSGRSGTQVIYDAYQVL
ncbi:hypothetical protein KC367_g5899 [Hortaea werneckii]|uniref:Uncharacterized protein n=1 Tax=Hortaea werneckii TaxID=91943 RepID=A0A3M7IXC2_HORWE|nr:hypothetical protein KC358_g11043 [Hortaea werneckii]KAI6818234.1 hypothetical protein KC350_g10369 [Hortaea werneckii]KAI6916713.1 hypothetical protein KC348_g11426 [Hortaea werneckii]KAI6929646.1 hypothetical protein KC341_g10730 [Hortaea werneckii]KAI6963774.1 hypothetical protein KC321_g11037 [Hortaea werneckii]